MARPLSAAFTAPLLALDWSCWAAGTVFRVLGLEFRI